MSEMSEISEMSEHSQHHEEREDLTDHHPGLAALLVVVLVAVSFGVTWISVRVLEPTPEVAAEHESALAARIAEDGAPLVDADLRAMRRALEARWALQARTYALREDERGFARIPVARAAELLLEVGFPVRAAAAGDDGRARRGEGGR